MKLDQAPTDAGINGNQLQSMKILFGAIKKLLITRPHLLGWANQASLRQPLRLENE